MHLFLSFHYFYSKNNDNFGVLFILMYTSIYIWGRGVFKCFYQIYFFLYSTEGKINIFMSFCSITLNFNIVLPKPFITSTILGNSQDLFRTDCASLVPNIILQGVLIFKTSVVVVVINHYSAMKLIEGTQNKLLVIGVDHTMVGRHQEQTGKVKNIQKSVFHDEQFARIGTYYNILKKMTLDNMLTVGKNWFLQDNWKCIFLWLNKFSLPSTFQKPNVHLTHTHTHHPLVVP